MLAIGIPISIAIAETLSLPSLLSPMADFRRFSAVTDLSPPDTLQE
jgi:hypothetical protein